MNAHREGEIIVLHLTQQEAEVVMSALRSIENPVSEEVKSKLAWVLKEQKEGNRE